jgi:hypothetical protein
MPICGNVSQPWADLPLKNGEDGAEYNNLYARYCHLGCPGQLYEDNCVEPWDCASKGRCRVVYEKWQKHLQKEANNGQAG